MSPVDASLCSHIFGPLGVLVVCCLHLKIVFRSFARDVDTVVSFLIFLVE